MKLRLKELGIDWLCIMAYLLLLALFFLAFYQFAFHGFIPKMNEMTIQVLVTIVSVLVIILVFAFLDYKKGGTIGKQKSNLTVVFEKPSFKASILRNLIKFLPWQFGHMGTLHMLQMNFEYDYTAMIYHYLAIFLALTMLLMGLIRKDGRHLGDLLAKTQVVEKK
ncbi:MAG: RDD family protein [Erysipelotrichaceae bacterium]|nr:RDD family protein [Erysipelotrichaceae bacterium]